MKKIIGYLQEGGFKADHFRKEGLFYFTISDGTWNNLLDHAHPENFRPRQRFFELTRLIEIELKRKLARIHSKASETVGRVMPLDSITGVRPGGVVFKYAELVKLSKSQKAAKLKDNLMEKLVQGGIAVEQF